MREGKWEQGRGLGQTKNEGGEGCVKKDVLSFIWAPHKQVPCYSLYYPELYIYREGLSSAHAEERVRSNERNTCGVESLPDQWKGLMKLKARPNVTKTFGGPSTHFILSFCLKKPSISILMWIPKWAPPHTWAYLILNLNLGELAPYIYMGGPLLSSMLRRRSAQKRETRVVWPTWGSTWGWGWGGF